MTETSASIAGLLVAPLVSSILSAMMTRIGGSQDFLPYGLIPLFYVFSFAATLFLGLPLFLLLSAYDLISWWSATISGAAVGVIFSFVISLPSIQTTDTALKSALVGAISAFSFWVVRGQGRQIAQ